MIHCRIGRPKGRFAASFLICCLAATQTMAQAGSADAGNGLPSAQEIWRHLPDQPPQTPETRPVRAPLPVALPRPGRPLPDAPAAIRPSTPTGARVVIHHSGSTGPERSLELAGHLRRAGFPQVEIRAVGFRVDKQSVRYFHHADQDVSQALGTLIGRDGQVDVADFTHFRPLPRTGTVEIWLP